MLLHVPLRDVNTFNEQLLAKTCLFKPPWTLASRRKRRRARMLNSGCLVAA